MTLASVAVRPHIKAPHEPQFRGRWGLPGKDSGLAWGRPRARRTGGAGHQQHPEGGQKVPSRAGFRQGPLGLPRAPPAYTAFAHNVLDPLQLPWWPLCWTARGWGSARLHVGSHRAGDELYFTK